MGWLRDFREGAGMTQAELAAKAGTTQPQISRLEKWPTKGGRKMTKEWADILASPLQIPPLWLLYGPGAIDLAEESAVRLGKAIAKATVRRLKEAQRESQILPAPLIPPTPLRGSKKRHPPKS